LTCFGFIIFDFGFPFVSFVSFVSFCLPGIVISVGFVLCCFLVFKSASFQWRRLDINGFSQFEIWQQS